MSYARPMTKPRPVPACASAALLGLLLLPACFFARTRVNEPVEAAREVNLPPGTPAAEVVAILGAPQQVVEIGNRSAYRYEYAQTKRAGLSLIVLTMINEDTRTDRVWAFFDEEDRLTHLATSFESDGTRYKLPFQRVE